MAAWAGRGDWRDQSAPGAQTPEADAIIGTASGVFVATLAVLALSRASVHYSYADCRAVCLDTLCLPEPCRAGIRAGLGEVGPGAYQMIFAAAWLWRGDWGFVAEHVSLQSRCCARPRGWRSLCFIASFPCACVECSPTSAHIATHCRFHLN